MVYDAVLKSIMRNLDNEQEIYEDSKLINDIGLDSLQLVNILLDLEEELDLCIDYEELDFDEIETVGQLASYLENAA